LARLELSRNGPLGAMMNVEDFETKHGEAALRRRYGGATAALRRRYGGATAQGS